MNEPIFEDLSNSLVDGEADWTYELTTKALNAGIEPLDIIQSGLMPGMSIVGEKFSTGEYFLPDLIIAAEGMQRAMDMIEPELMARGQKLENPGTIVIGTVEGDIHEIGKKLVSTMLTANGFKVYDLGVDVPTEKFISKVLETGADLIGLSALLTTTMTVQRDVISAIIDSGIRDQVKIIVGGAPVTREWSEEIGADGYAEDAMSAVRLVKTLLSE